MHILVTPYHHSTTLILSPIDLSTAGRIDPETFYYVQDDHELPSDEISLTCSRWRHGKNAIDFTFEICPNDGVNSVKGIIELSIHAKKLVKS